MKKIKVQDYNSYFWDSTIQNLMAHDIAKEIPDIIRDIFEEHSFELLKKKQRRLFLKLLATSDGLLNDIQKKQVKDTLQKKIFEISDKIIPPEEKKVDIKYFNSLFNKRQKFELEFLQKGIKKDYNSMDRERFGLILKELRLIGFDNENILGLAASLGTMRVFPVRPKGKGDKLLNRAISWDYPRIYRPQKER